MNGTYQLWRKRHEQQIAFYDALGLDGKAVAMGRMASTKHLSAEEMSVIWVAWFDRFSPKREHRKMQQAGSADFTVDMIRVVRVSGKHEYEQSRAGNTLQDAFSPIGSRFDIARCDPTRHSL